ncbi:hypothetical protein CPB83DRAFT_893578 [Crepidotus variabilis]|uniref:Uncharacterized protein n=1 Tax=Crepidotus variabilis TaxID=179855 RepID=A0A9P6JR87_9AGAR|nr:hypothetical protein CPB83DRAFT_893578 [Crepidotus variabilis]
MFSEQNQSSNDLYDLLRPFTTFYDLLRPFTTFYDLLRPFTTSRPSFYVSSKLETNFRRSLPPSLEDLSSIYPFTIWLGPLFSLIFLFLPFKKKNKTQKHISFSSFKTNFPSPFFSSETNFRCSLSLRLRTGPQYTLLPFVSVHSLLSGLPFFFVHKSNDIYDLPASSNKISKPYAVTAFTTFYDLYDLPAPRLVSRLLMFSF